MCLNWAGTGPMLAASAQNQLSSGVFYQKALKILN